MSASRSRVRSGRPGRSLPLRRWTPLCCAGWREPRSLPAEGSRRAASLPSTVEASCEHDHRCQRRDPRRCPPGRAEAKRSLPPLSPDREGATAARLRRALRRQDARYSVAPATGERHSRRWVRGTGTARSVAATGRSLQAVSRPIERPGPRAVGARRRGPAWPRSPRLALSAWLEGGRYRRWLCVFVGDGRVTASPTARERLAQARSMRSANCQANGRNDPRNRVRRRSSGERRRSTAPSLQHGRSAPADATPRPAARGP